MEATLEPVGSRSRLWGGDVLLTVCWQIDEPGAASIRLPKRRAEMVRGLAERELAAGRVPDLVALDAEAGTW